MLGSLRKHSAVLVISLDAVYFVDAMSTFGAVPLSMVDSNIDFMVSSSNKCIEGTPGFSYAIANTKKLLACKGNYKFNCLDVMYSTCKSILLVMRGIC